MPRFALAAPISCGQTISATTTASSQVDQYTYSGNAGDLVSFALYWSCNGNGTADIYAPSGQLFTNVTTGCSGNAIRVTLPATGTYTVLIHSSTYSSTANYAFGIQSLVGGGCNAKALACGQQVATNTASDTSMDAYSYSGNAGDLVSFALYWSCNGNGTADIYTPSGQLFTNVTTGCTGNAIKVALPATGIYTILIHSSTYSSTANYAFGIQSLVGGGCNAKALTCGQQVATNTAFDTSMDAYSYSGSAGDLVSFALYWSCNGNGTADIYGPAGQLFTNVMTGCTGNAIKVILPATGMYTILIHSSTYSSTANYAFGIQSLTGGGCNTKALTCGQQVATNTAFYSSMDAYSYSGNAGDLVSFALYWSCNGNGTADIYAPSGQLFTSVTTGCTGNAINVTLPATGTYTILIHSSTYSSTANYAFGIQSLTGGGCDSKALNCGQQVATNTAFDTSMDAYSYSGTAGDIVSFALYWSCNGNGRADIYTPAGQLLTNVTTGCIGNATKATLPTTGIYTILVHSSTYSSTADYAFGIQSLTAGGCNFKALTCGQTFTGQITNNAAADAYELVASSDEHVILSDSGFNGMVVNIYDPNGTNIVSIGSSTSTNFTFAATAIYTVVVHPGSYSSTGSYSLTLTVFGGCASIPTVTVTPATQTIDQGSPAMFTANASGPAPLFYQWRFNNQPIAPATNSTLSISQAQTNNAGSYTVVVTNPGGAITNAPPAILFVRIKPQITWPNPLSITYGTALSSLQLNATANVPGTFTYSPAVGTMPNSGSNQVLSVLFTPTDTNSYATANANVAIDVERASLLIAATNRTKSYGQTVSLIGTELIASGLVNGDSVTSTSISSTGAPASAPVSGSPYSILISDAVGSPGLTNYNIVYNAGLLTINPVSLTVKANDVSRAAGQPNPTFTASYTGFVNGESVAASDVTGAPSLTCSADVNSPAGNYAITTGVGTLKSTNYSFNLLNGTLSISTANHAPIANDDAYSLNANDTLTVPAPGVLANDTDQDGDILTAVLLTGPSHGSLTLDANGGFTYNPNSAYVGIDSFTYVVNDGTVNSTAATVTLTITPSTSLDTGLVAYYPLNGDARDASGNGNDGTVHGAVAATDRFGVSNGCMSFSSGAYISAPADKLPTTNRTVALWFTTQDVSVRPGLLGYGGNSCGDSFFMGLNHWGDSSWVVSTHCGVYNLEVPYTQPPTNAWHHWAAVMDANTLTFYVDGVVIGSRQGVTETYVAGKQLGLGTIASPSGTTPYTDGNVGYFNGSLDEVRIYNRALSPDEIALLAAGSPRHPRLSLVPNGNRVSLSLSGDPAYSYVIQSSSNLVNWMNTPMAVPVGGILSTNLQKVGNQLFYRAVMQ